MGQLVDGKWTDQWYDTESTKGQFVRAQSEFRNWITADGAAGPSGRSGFKAAAQRYHLIVSYACPWAHRALIYRRLKGLDDIIGLSAVHWLMGENGWTFEADDDGVVVNNISADRYVYEIYCRADQNFSGRVTVPVLWDLETKTIVSNESAEIIRMLNSAFDEVGALDGDYYPGQLQRDIDTINERVFAGVNNGVYRAGFATTQSAYDEAVQLVFETLDWLDQRLATQRFLTGENPVEADWRLLPTLLRFDLVYHGHFKCNLRRLVDYEHLWPYARDLYQWPGIAGTCNFEHIKRHYYGSHDKINPSRIVPAGPMIDFSAPHGRA